MLTLRAVRYQYVKGAQWILDGVDLSVASGQRVGIWGDNGSGKSTLVNVILGILQPQEGEVAFDRRRVTAARHFPDVGYVGDPGINDSELGLPLGVLVSDLLDTFRVIHVRTGRRLDRDLWDLLEIDRLSDRRTDDLSSGERKRVMLAMALAVERRVLILDEPTEGIDHSVLDDLLVSVRSYADECGCALILVSHRQDELALLTQDLYRMSERRLVRQSVPAFRVEWSREPQGKSDDAVMSLGVLQWRLRQQIKDPSWSSLSLRVKRSN